jgi:hypothetical protein
MTTYNSIYHAESVAHLLELRGMKLVARYKNLVLVFDERFSKDRACHDTLIKASPYCLHNAITGEYLSNHQSIESVLDSTKTLESDWLHDKKHYWLGASWGNYQMKWDNFGVGNCNLARHESVYSDESIDEGRHKSYMASSTSPWSKKLVAGLLSEKLNTKIEVMSVSPAINHPGCAWLANNCDAYLFTKQEYLDYYTEMIAEDLPEADD